MNIGREPPPVTTSNRSPRARTYREGSEAPPQEPRRLLERDPGKHAAVLVLVPEGAEAKVFAEAKPPELEHRSPMNVSRQEAHDHVGPPAQVSEQLLDPRIELRAVVVLHLACQVTGIAVQ